MYSFRYLKRLSVWIILFLQVFAMGVYFYLQNEPIKRKKASSDSVSFLDKINTTEAITLTYHTITSRILLKTVNTRENYVDFNTSLCFINGTDIKLMQRTKNNWKCTCLPRWHGNACEQPEVLWRALLAYRKPLTIKGPRKFQRRLIYIFEINNVLEDITEIRINELNDVVDLFVLYESKNSNFQSRLKNNFLKQFHNKILYLNGGKSRELWLAVKNVISNLQNDDIVLASDFNEIPNKYSLLYFKFYNKWPEPLSFRLRWSVYGFYWLHPSRTIVGGCVVTVRYLYEMLDNDLSLLNHKQTDKLSKNFILGDLNHVGGWFCEFCNDATLIIEYLNSKPSNNPIRWENVTTKTIDNSYVEDLIENGVYLDGKTQLVRAHRYHDHYYAPQYVEDNSWKFDFLLVNMYSKIDY